MSEFIEINWTSGSLDEARQVSRYLVQERLVASAQIVPWIESIYMWNGQLETSQESKVVMKTHRDRFDEIKEVILKNCKYQVPEITYSTIEGGNEAYFDWLRDATMSTK